VSKVTQNQEGVTVLTRKGEKYQASYLIMAAPPMAIKKIHF
jgi:monoamine oxidase